MIRKIPIVATPIFLKDLFHKTPDVQEKFIETFSNYLNQKYLFLLNSGTSSFFIILNTLRKIFDKQEVILPAYTASSLVIAIRKAGLKPILCDISLDNFNLDVNLLPNLVSKDTLCILGVHMFGIPDKNLKDLKQKFPELFIIEDCAQSLGTKIGNIPVGNLGDVSFFSFNRGKNLPTYGGGCIATNNLELAKKLETQIQELKSQNQLYAFFRMIVLYLAVKPFFYGLFYPFISIFKEQILSKDFKIRQYGNFQAGVAFSIFKRIDELSSIRYNNGMRLIDSLKDMDNIIVPKITKDMEPAFNRLPILFRDINKIKKVQKRLWNAGIESNQMYFKPLHQSFDLGYEKEDFPVANYFAEHLLTIPVHPLVRKEELDIMVDVIRNTI